MEFLGWFGAMLLATCGVPQAIKTYKTKSATDISWLFLLMWFFGEVFLLSYVVFECFSWPLILNYALNAIITFYIIIIKSIEETDDYNATTPTAT